MSDRAAQERAEELAAEEYPYHLPGGLSSKVSTWRHAFVTGFLAREAEPTTVTAEQIEAAAQEHYETSGRDSFNRPWPELPVIQQADFREWQRVAFRAAGFRIEGDLA